MKDVVNEIDTFVHNTCAKYGADSVRDLVKLLELAKTEIVNLRAESSKLYELLLEAGHKH